MFTGYVLLHGKTSSSFSGYFEQLFHYDKTFLRSGLSSLKYQISKVTGCGLKRIGDLAFSMRYGSCFTTDAYMVLCFSQNEEDQCRRGTNPMGSFEPIEKSKFDHYLNRLSASKGISPLIFIVKSYEPPVT